MLAFDQGPPEGILASKDAHEAGQYHYITSCTHKSGAQVHAFLEAFADEFDLRRHIRCRTRVIRVHPLRPSGKWGAGPWAVTAEPVGSSLVWRPHHTQVSNVYSFEASLPCVPV